MSDSDHLNRRSAVRHPLTGELSGRLVSKDSGSTIPCIAVNVSATGLQVIMSLDPEPGVSLELQVAGHIIPLTVIWCTREPSKRGYFSVGLCTENQSDNLELMFIPKS